MRLLLDTHILLWAARSDPALPDQAAQILCDPANALLFSAGSIWEVSIKSGLGRDDFEFDPHRLRQGLLDNLYEELPISGAHAAAVSQLPPIHKDPFDRLLIAQASLEGLILLTADTVVASYPGPILKV